MATKKQESEASTAPAESEASNAPAESEASNVPESDANNMLAFALPDVTEAGDGFISDEPESGETDSNHTTAEDMRASADTLNAGPPKAEASRGRISSGGDIYDPAIHVYPPSETAKTKKWRKKSKSKVEQETRPGDVDVSAAIRTDAENWAYMYGGAHTLIYGPEGGAISKPEQLIPLMDALERCFQQNGTVPMRPEVQAVIAAGGYTMRVANREQNKARTAEILASVKNVYAATVGRFANFVAVKLKLRKPKTEQQPTPEQTATQPADKRNEPLVAGSGQ